MEMGKDVISPPVLQRDGEGKLLSRRGQKKLERQRKI